MMTRQLPQVRLKNAHVEILQEPKLTVHPGVGLRAQCPLWVISGHTDKFGAVSVLSPISTLGGTSKSAFGCRFMSTRRFSHRAVANSRYVHALPERFSAQPKAMARLARKIA